MSTVKLPVTNGPMTLVDDDIARKLEGKKLFRSVCGRYVGLYHEGKTILLHRFVMNAPADKFVDHLYGKTFDNRRESLRVCNSSQNSMNRRMPSNSSTGYRLVYKDHCPHRFRLIRHVNRKSTHIANFRSRHVAGIFADQILVQIVGPFVRKNFQGKVTSSGLADFLERTAGRIFKVVFSRRSDGRQREMVCRTGVKVHQTGGTILFNPISRNLFSVYDIQKKSYRFIPLENVICIRFAKTNYRVVA